MNKYFAPLIATSALVAGCSFSETSPEGHTATPESQIQVEGPEASTVSKLAVEAYFSEYPYIEIVDLDIGENDGAINDVEVSVDLNLLPELNPEVSARVQGAIAIIQGEEPEGWKFGSGFLMHDAVLDKTFLMTAAHVPDKMKPESIFITLNDSSVVSYDYISLYYNDPDVENDPDWQDKQEDIAYIELADQGLSNRALRGRDLLTNPLKTGEMLYAVNFQENHIPGQPATYGVMYMGESLNGRFGDLLGDLDIDKDEDDVRGGASGGVIVDANGEVVGMSISAINYDDYRPISCHLPAYNTASTKINSQRVWTDIHLPGNAECELGYSQATMRQVESGFFVPNSTVELEQISKG